MYPVDLENNERSCEYSKNKSKKLTILFKLCTNKNHSYKHNEQINNQNIDNSECFGVKNFAHIVTVVRKFS
jgi:hypothetical protein